MEEYKNTSQQERRGIISHDHTSADGFIASDLYQKLLDLPRCVV